MPKVNVKLSAFDLDKGRYSRTLDEAIKQQLRMAARAFLNVAVRAIPVRTGFARGSLRNLAEAAGLGGAGGPSIDFSSPAGQFLRIAREIRTSSFAKSDKSGLFKFTRRSLTQAGAKTPIEFYRDGKRRILKTPQSGRQFATQSSQIFQSNQFVYTFNFEVMISYFNINDVQVNPRNRGTPWNSFKFGRTTFLNYLKNEGLRKLPSVQAFIMESFISVSGGSVSRTSFGVISRNSRFKGV